MSEVKKESEVTQSCPTLCDPMECSLPGFSVHGIFQARVLEWVAISFSRRSSWPRDWTQVSCIVSRRFTVWATREIHLCQSVLLIFSYKSCVVYGLTSKSLLHFESILVYGVKKCSAAAAKLLQSCLTSVRPHRRQPTRLPHPWDSPGKNTGVGCHFLFQSMKVKSESEVAQLCLTLSDPMDCSPPGFSVHGIFQARVLEWSAIAFSKKCSSFILLYGAVQFSQHHLLRRLYFLHCIFLPPL